MIQLLEGNEKIKQKENGTIDYNDLLLQKLELAKETKQLVYTQGIRNIGKTYALVEFAKKYDYIVVVCNSQLAISLRKECNYNKICSNDIKDFNNRYILASKVVIDEGVKNISELKSLYCDIVTGYTESYRVGTNTFNEMITNTLEEEVIVLYEKIREARENENYGTYKNLIQAYKEILDMINRYVK